MAWFSQMQTDCVFVAAADPFGLVAKKKKFPALIQEENSLLDDIEKAGNMTLANKTRNVLKFTRQLNSAQAMVDADLKCLELGTLPAIPVSVKTRTLAKKELTLEKGLKMRIDTKQREIEKFKTGISQSIVELSMRLPTELYGRFWEHYCKVLEAIRIKDKKKSNVAAEDHQLSHSTEVDGDTQSGHFIEVDRGNSFGAIQPTISVPPTPIATTLTNASILVQIGQLKDPPVLDAARSVAVLAPRLVNKGIRLEFDCVDDSDQKDNFAAQSDNSKLRGDMKQLRKSLALMYRLLPADMFLRFCAHYHIAVVNCVNVTESLEVIDNSKRHISSRDHLSKHRQPVLPFRGRAGDAPHSAPDGIEFLGVVDNSNRQISSCDQPKHRQPVLPRKGRAGEAPHSAPDDIGLSGVVDNSKRQISSLDHLQKHRQPVLPLKGGAGDVPLFTRLSDSRKASNDGFGTPDYRIKREDNSKEKQLDNTVVRDYGKVNNSPVSSSGNILAGHESGRGGSDHLQSLHPQARASFTSSSAAPLFTRLSDTRNSSKHSVESLGNVKKTEEYFSQKASNSLYDKTDVSMPERAIDSGTTQRKTGTSTSGLQSKFNIGSDVDYKPSRLPVDNDSLIFERMHKLENVSKEIEKLKREGNSEDELLKHGKEGEPATNSRSSRPFPEPKSQLLHDVLSSKGRSNTSNALQHGNLPDAGYCIPNSQPWNKPETLKLPLVPVPTSSLMVPKIISCEVYPDEKTLLLNAINNANSILATVQPVNLSTGSLGNPNLPIWDKGEVVGQNEQTNLMPASLQNNIVAVSTSNSILPPLSHSKAVVDYTHFNPSQNHKNRNNSDSQNAPHRGQSVGSVFSSPKKMFPERSTPARYDDTRQPLPSKQNNLQHSDSLWPNQGSDNYSNSRSLERNNSESRRAPHSQQSVTSGFSSPKKTFPERSTSTQNYDSQHPLPSKQENLQPSNSLRPNQGSDNYSNSWSLERNNSDSRHDPLRGQSVGGRSDFSSPKKNFPKRSTPARYYESQQPLPSKQNNLQPSNSMQPNNNYSDSQSLERRIVSGLKTELSMIQQISDLNTKLGMMTNSQLSQQLSSRTDNPPSSLQQPERDNRSDFVQLEYESEYHRSRRADDIDHRPLEPRSLGSVRRESRIDDYSSNVRPEHRTEDYLDSERDKHRSRSSSRRRDDRLDRERSDHSLRRERRFDDYPDTLLPERRTEDYSGHQRSKLRHRSGSLQSEHRVDGYAASMHFDQSGEYLAERDKRRNRSSSRRRDDRLDHERSDHPVRRERIFDDYPDTLHPERRTNDPSGHQRSKRRRLSGSQNEHRIDGYAASTHFDRSDEYLDYKRHEYEMDDYLY